MEAQTACQHICVFSAFPATDLWKLSHKIDTKKQNNKSRGKVTPPPQKCNHCSLFDLKYICGGSKVVSMVRKYGSIMINTKQHYFEFSFSDCFALMYSQSACFSVCSRNCEKIPDMFSLPCSCCPLMTWYGPKTLPFAMINVSPSPLLTVPLMSLSLLFFPLTAGLSNLTKDVVVRMCQSADRAYI